MDYTIKSLVKAFEIIELLADKSMTAKKISECLAINKSTLHRFLYTLEVLNYIEQTENNQYHLSSKFFRLGSVHDTNSLVHIAKPFLHEISEKYGESSLLACYENNHVFYVDKVESPHTLRVVIEPGEIKPCYTVASGKLLLSEMTKEDLEEYIHNEDLYPYTSNTIIEKERLYEELKKIRLAGFAIDNEELAEGLRGVAAPVRNQSGKIIAALCVAGVSTRFNDRKARMVSKDLIEMAKKVSFAILY